MKRLTIVVEGQTEETFVNELLARHFQSFGFFDVRPIKIGTSNSQKGGFVNYTHLKNDVQKYLREPNTLVTTFVDFFRIPTNMPEYERAMREATTSQRINILEEAMSEDIGNDNFIPHIQPHEFEALLFSDSQIFADYFDERTAQQIESVIKSYGTPEDINNSPETAPSKRLSRIIPKYDKVFLGNMIALEIGIDKILEKCPHFRSWVENLLERMRE